jgi:hypothetical protein
MAGIINATYHDVCERFAKALYAKGLSITDSATLAGSLALMVHTTGFDLRRALLAAEALHEIADDYAAEEEARPGEPLEIESGELPELPQVQAL